MEYAFVETEFAFFRFLAGKAILFDFSCLTLSKHNFDKYPLRIVACHFTKFCRRFWLLYPIQSLCAYDIVCNTSVSSGYLSCHNSHSFIIRMLKLFFFFQMKSLLKIWCIHACAPLVAWGQGNGRRGSNTCTILIGTKGCMYHIYLNLFWSFCQNIFTLKGNICCVSRTIKEVIILWLCFSFCNKAK